MRPYLRRPGHLLSCIVQSAPTQRNETIVVTYSVFFIHFFVGLFLLWIHTEHGRGREKVRRGKKKGFTGRRQRNNNDDQDNLKREREREKEETLRSSRYSELHRLLVRTYVCVYGIR